MWHYGTTQSQYYDNDINYNDDNAIHPSMWIEVFGGLFECQKLWYMEGIVIIRSEI